MNTDSSTDFSYRGLYQYLRLPSSLLSIEDLKRLFDDLGRLTSQAVDSYLYNLDKPQGLTDEEFLHEKENIKRIGRLAVIVTGKNGEQLVASTAELLDARKLPDDIETIAFDSALNILAAYPNISLNNRFKLKMDFSEPPSFSEYNPWDKPTPNDSNLEVQGTNETWCRGVIETAMQFLRNRKTSRGWLHSPITFSFLNWLIGFPLAFWIVVRMSSVFSLPLVFENLALRGAFYVYILLLSLLVFRGSVGLLRWIFPLFELRERGTSWRVRSVAGALLLGLFVAVVYDIVSFFWASI